jgi:hypothetical protein
MKKLTFFFFIFLFYSLSVYAQFPQFPKIGQPKPTPTPKVSTNPNNNSTNNNSNSNNNSSTDLQQKPMANETPVFLKTTLDVRCDMENRYWKLPNESNYTSWIPQVKFKVFYKSNVQLRYLAEYFTPDGKSWFSETLNQSSSNFDYQTVEISSSRGGSDRFVNKSTIAVGTYGVKITNTRDNSVVFEGKFKVGKYKYGPNIPMFKNQYSFYVEQDWNLPIGYVWLDWATTGTASALPKVSVWIKDDIRAGDLEARLFYNGQELATTDDMGEVRDTDYRYPNVYEDKALAYWKLWDFAWYKFRYLSSLQARKNFPIAKFLNDMDGEYTVKILYKAQQIREVKFSVSGGNLVDNGIAKQNNFTENKIIVPVKIMNTTEKWNANAWKTDAFYANPLTGFSLQ